MPFAEKFGVQPDIVHNIHDIMNIECPSRLSGEPYEDTTNYNRLNCSVNSIIFRNFALSLEGDAEIFLQPSIGQVKL